MFSLLGTVEAAVGGQSVELGPPKRRCVLALLLLDLGQVVAVDRLIDVLWPDSPPPGARRVVLVHVSRLRTALASAGADRHGVRIVTTGTGYALHAAPETVDANRFHALCDQARGQDAEKRLRLLDQALGLWRGPALTGAMPPDARAALAHGLEEARTVAREDRIDALLTLGLHQAVLAEVTDLVHGYPLRERPVGQLMLAEYRAGRTADALNTYHVFRKRLAEELGLDPGARLRDLEAAILQQDPGLESTTAPPAAGPVVPVASTPAQLPPAVPAFAGREAESAALTRAVDEAPGATVVCVISGTAGVGKTALAVHWAHRMTDRFPDGQMYVNLRGFDPGGQVMDPADALSGLLDALGVPAQRVPPGIDAQAALFRSLVAGRRFLLVLDNARDAEQVRPLLPGSPTAAVVVTSRHQLTQLVVDGAYAVPLPVMSAAESRDLLARRLGRDRTGAEPAAVDAIVAACARLPLALCVVAARAAAHPTFPLEAIAAELGDARNRLAALTTGDPTRDIRAVLSWSCHELSPAALRVFRLLGTHPGPDVSIAAAASLTGSPRDRLREPLDELARANLITEQTPGRYAFHDLLRAYAADLPDGGDDREVAVDRMLDHYTYTALDGSRLLDPTREPSLFPPGELLPGTTLETFDGPDDALGWFNAEHHVLMAVLRVVADRGAHIRASQLMSGLSTFLNRRGHWSDLATAGRVALAAAIHLDDPLAEARAHRVLARARTLLQADPAETVDHLDRALALYAEVGDSTGKAATHRILGYVYEQQGHFDKALLHSRQALALYEAAQDANGQAMALNTVGWYLVHLGRTGSAIDYCERAVRLHQQTRDRGGEGCAWDSLGYAHHDLGDHSAAVECFQRALGLFREVGDRYEESVALTHLGDAYHAVSDPAARPTWQQALRILVDLDHTDADGVKARLVRPPERS